MAESNSQTEMTQAGEYVLGTLDADARMHFEQQLGHDDEARRELSYWEQRLGALGLGLEPVFPPEHVWTRIEDQIELGRVVPIAAAEQHKASSGVGIWRSLAVAASVAALVMAAMLFTGSSEQSSSPGPDATGPAYASMVYDAPTGTSWLVTAQDGSDKLSVTAMGSYEVPAGKVLRAWLVPADGKPLSIGDWPHTRGVHQMPVSTAAANYMSRHASLMVSMESVDSSSPDKPSGQLMWTSPLAARAG